MGERGRQKIFGRKRQKMKVKVLVRYQVSKIVVLKWVNRCTILKILALGMRRGAANLRSAPGGRHSSYTTADE